MTAPRPPRHAPGRLAAKLVYRRDGRLSGLKISAAALAAVAVFTAISVPIIVASGVDTTTGIAAWVVTLFFFVKLPALAIFWWLIVRHVERPGQETLTSDEVAPLIDRLRAQADRVAGRSGAEQQLAQLLDDAWFVADRAPDADKAAAVACALHIQELVGVRGRATRGGPAT